MLRAIEMFLHTTIDNVLPVQVTVVTGPHKPTVAETVVIHARGLQVEPPGKGEEDEAAYLVPQVEWTTDGIETNFDISISLTGEVLEVQSPPGVLMDIGDQLYIEERTLYFYHAPAAADPGVQARLRGEDAAGWKRQQDCSLTLDLTAWAPNMPDADAHLATTLNVALAELVQLPILELSRTVGVDVVLRVLTPRVSLVSLEREVHPTEALFRASAILELHAKLDIMVAKGAPTPQGIIGEINESVALKQS